MCIRDSSLIRPAVCGAGPVEATYFGSPWYLGLQNQESRLSGPRLNGLQVTCGVSAPLPANATFSVCDRLGNCAAMDVNGNPRPPTVRTWLPIVVK